MGMTWSETLKTGFCDDAHIRAINGSAVVKCSAIVLITMVSKLQLHI